MPKTLLFLLTSNIKEKFKRKQSNRNLHLAGFDPPLNGIFVWRVLFCLPISCLPSVWAFWTLLCLVLLIFRPSGKEALRTRSKREKKTKKKTRLHEGWSVSKSLRQFPRHCKRIRSNKILLFARLSPYNPAVARHAISQLRKLRKKSWNSRSFH